MEFAIDNVQTLKLRKAKFQARPPQDAVRDDLNNAQQNAESHAFYAHPTKSRKRKSRDEKGAMKHSELKNAEMEKTVAAEEGQDTKRPRHNPAGEKTKPSSKENLEGSNKKIKGSNRKPKDRKGGLKPDVGSSSKVETNVNNAHKIKVEAVSQSKERTRQEQKQRLEGERNTKRKRSKQNKNPSGEVVDKLDMLIEQYRSKFSQPKSGKQDSKKLRRWFQA